MAELCSEGDGKKASMQEGTEGDGKKASMVESTEGDGKKASMAEGTEGDEKKAPMLEGAEGDEKKAPMLEGAEGDEKKASMLEGTGGDGRKASMLEEQDVQEEDVWAVVKEKDSSGLKPTKADSLSPSPSACLLPPIPRVVPRVHSGNFDPRGVADLVVHQHRHYRHPYQSAPLDVPDWSKIYGTNKNLPDDNSDSSNGAWAVKANDHGRRFADFAKHDDDDDDSEEMIPPHEIIARRMARSPVVSYSMCEGIGRTLKGRDLCTVRNAILAKTGFLES